MIKFFVVFYCRIWFFAQKWEMYFPKGLVCNLEMLISLERAGVETHQACAPNLSFFMNSTREGVFLHPPSTNILRISDLYIRPCWDIGDLELNYSAIALCLSPPASQQFKFNSIIKYSLFSRWQGNLLDI